jgi:indole-3-glycerol phosphate synthase
MTDFLDTLAMDATKTIDSRYYETKLVSSQPKSSMRNAILESKDNAIIAEIKSASPSLGTLRTEINTQEVVMQMEKGGAVGISVLTEPKHFNGSLNTLKAAREATKLPILMKDIVIVTDQIEVAAQLGANTVLLIEALFDRGCCEMGRDKMIAFSHSKGLEVLLETHTEQEFQKAIYSEADLVGINNRNLKNLEIDINTTKQILEKHKNPKKTVISESGIKTKTDLKFLRSCGANAFLIGSSIMLHGNIEEKIREFVLA